MNVEKIMSIDDILDKTLDIFCICLGVSLIIGLPIFFYNTSKNIEEEKCVKFYKENNYILESCEIYKKRLELLNK